MKLCVLALQMQRAAEIRCELPWARIAHALGGLKAVRYRSEGRTIVQRTKISAELAATLKNLGVSAPKQILTVVEPLPASPRHRYTPPIRPSQAIVMSWLKSTRLPRDRELRLRCIFQRFSCRLRHSLRASLNFSRINSVGQEGDRHLSARSSGIIRLLRAIVNPSPEASPPVRH